MSQVGFWTYKPITLCAKDYAAINFDAVAMQSSCKTGRYLRC